MDRNKRYEDWQMQQMQENTCYRKEHGSKSESDKTIKRSPSKEQIALINISEIMFDNKLNIQENDYLKLMNSLKDLAKFKIV